MGGGGKGQGKHQFMLWSTLQVRSWEGEARTSGSTSSCSGARCRWANGAGEGREGQGEHHQFTLWSTRLVSVCARCGKRRAGAVVTSASSQQPAAAVAAAGELNASVSSWHLAVLACYVWGRPQDHQISRFTSENKEQFAGDAGITITTFTMVAFSGQRSAESEKVRLRASTLPQP